MHNMGSLMKWEIIIPHRQQHRGLAIGLKTANPKCSLSYSDREVINLDAVNWLRRTRCPMASLSKRSQSGQPVIRQEVHLLVYVGKCRSPSGNYLSRRQGQEFQGAHLLVKTCIAVLFLSGRQILTIADIDELSLEVIEESGSITLWIFSGEV